jgi:phage baseplate assembly protein W
MNKNQYRDLDLNMPLNPFTGDIVVATGVDAVKKALRHIVLSVRFDMPFDPEIGSDIYGTLFENFSVLGVEFMKSKLREQIEEYEPRVRLEGITIQQREQFHEIAITINYTIVEINRKDNLTVFVGRTR